MFGFFKNKDKAQTKKATEPEKELSVEEKEAIEQEIEALNQELNQTEKTNSSKLASLYEKKGLKQAELNEKEQAIGSLETSLEQKLSIGDGYKKLMNLYNSKRAEAARNGDDQSIDYYMNKMDEMRQIAKKVTTSR